MTDEPSPPENPRLLAAMRAVAEDRNDDTMRELFAALIAGELIVPVREQRGDGVELAVREHPEEGTTFYAFSSPAALLEGVPGGAPYVALPARKLAELALAEEGATLVVDYSSGIGGRLSRQDLNNIADGLIPGAEGSVIAPGGGPMQVFSLERALAPPFAAAVAEAARDAQRVTAAHAFEVSLGGPRHLAFGLELEPGAGEPERRAALRALSAAAQPHLAPGEPLDVLALEGTLLDLVRTVGRPLWPGAPIPAGGAGRD